MVGTDIIEIERISKSITSERFLKRIFTKKEIEYIFSKGSPAQTAAGIFCVKEAVSKALGTGISQGVAFLDIEISHDENYAPKVSLSGEALSRMSLLGFNKANVSISHCKQYSIAFCVLN